MMHCLPQIHVAAIHAQAGFRSDVPGLGVLCRNDGDAVIGAGGYSNSIGKFSAYAIAGYEPFRIGSVRFGAIAGVVNGYGRGVTPMAAAVASIPFNWGEMHIVLIPPVPRVTPLTVQFSFTIKP